MFVELIDQTGERSRIMFFNDLILVGCNSQRAKCDGVSSTDLISKLIALFARALSGGLDVKETMGGERLYTKVAVRRRWTSGPGGRNFDIVCDSDLRDLREQHALKN